MNESQKAKVARFLNDKVMNDAVREILRQSFSKQRPNADVNVLAAAFLALGLLDEAWRDLSKYAPNEQEDSVSTPNVGL